MASIVARNCVPVKAISPGSQRSVVNVCVYKTSHQRFARGSPKGRDLRHVILMGNKATTGPFAPIVRITRQIVGQKEFNKLRGKAISLHSQVIKDFCGQIGAGPKQAQQVIRLAKKNGEKLGFLA
eukprot:TRINITY_DN40007_c0_g1_i1.p2 TRINITY_DN40007_c0_g1~~TRINITY_DN40007_c0_g1_i1.p2  ORF type:complete len:125 (-),score=2.53 TRINITY_DN40007_c0_g1_i1:293-667(-)